MANLQPRVRVIGVRPDETSSPARRSLAFAVDSSISGVGTPWYAVSKTAQVVARSTAIPSWTIVEDGLARPPFRVDAGRCIRDAAVPDTRCAAGRRGNGPRPP